MVGWYRLQTVFTYPRGTQSGTPILTETALFIDFSASAAVKSCERAANIPSVDANNNLVRQNELHAVLGAI